MVEQKKFTLQDRTKTFRFENFEYTLEFGNTGKIMQTALLRTKLSDGEMDRLGRYMTQDAKLTMALIELEVVLMVYCPQFFTDFGIKTLKDLDFFQALELSKIYSEQLFAWFNFWDEVMKNPEKFLPPSYVNKTEEAGEAKKKAKQKKKKPTAQQVQQAPLQKDAPTFQGEPLQGLDTLANME